MPTFSMAVSDWSHPCWDMIHISAHTLATNPHRVRALVHHITSLFNVLPCPVCRTHALSMLRTLSRPLRTQSDVSVAMWQFHNSVNRRLGKPHFTWTQYTNRYQDMDPRRIVSVFRKRMLHTIALTRSVPSLANLPKIVNAFAEWAYPAARPPVRRVGSRKLAMAYAR